MSKDGMKELGFWSVIVILIIAMAAFIGRTKAQDDPYVEYSVSCMVATDFDTLQIHFVVSANVEDTYTFSTDLPTTIPAQVTTQIGSFDLGYVTMESAQTPNTYHLYATQASSGTVLDLPFNTWTTPECTDKPVSVPYPTTVPMPVITPEPDGTECPAISIDGRTGVPFCLWSLPYAKR